MNLRTRRSVRRNEDRVPIVDQIQRKEKETYLQNELAKEKESKEKSDLEAKVGTAVDNAVNKIVGIHKSNNAGRTLVGDPELDKTKETLQQQKKELESVKANLDKQKEMNNQLSQKNLEKDKKIEQMST